MKRQLLTLLMVLIWAGCAGSDSAPLTGSDADALNDADFNFMSFNSNNGNGDKDDDTPPTPKGGGNTSDNGTAPDTPNQDAQDELASFSPVPSQNTPVKLAGHERYDLEQQCGIFTMSGDPAMGTIKKGCSVIKERDIINRYAILPFWYMKNSVTYGYLRQFCHPDEPTSDEMTCNKKKKDYINHQLQKARDEFFAEKDNVIHKGLADALGTRSWNWKYFREHLWVITDIEWYNYVNNVGGCGSLEPKVGDHSIVNNRFTNSQCQSFYGTY